MFTFTDSYGNPVDAPIFDAMQEARGSDVAYLPILLAAAIAADEAGYCPVYDDIALNIGAPTRDDLRALGLLNRDFNVTFRRTVPVTIIVSQEVTMTVSASNPRDAREQYEEGNVDIEWPDLDYYGVRDAQDRYGDITVDDSEEEVELYRVFTE